MGIFLCLMGCFGDDKYYDFRFGLLKELWMCYDISYCVVYLYSCFGCFDVRLFCCLYYVFIVSCIYLYV